MKIDYTASIKVYDNADERSIFRKLKNDESWWEQSFGVNSDGCYAVYAKKFNTIGEMRDAVCEILDWR